MICKASWLINRCAFSTSRYVTNRSCDDTSHFLLLALQEDAFLLVRLAQRIQKGTEEDLHVTTKNEPCYSYHPHLPLSYSLVIP